MRVLIAFDKFKDSLTAREAGEQAAAALRQLHPDWVIELCPLTDGGEGFCEILTSSCGGEITIQTVTGPRHGNTGASRGIVPLERIPAEARKLLEIPHASRAVAVIEMASASGLALLANDQRDPWQTTTRGTGELIRAAAQGGVGAILLGVGGSATHDLGLGALEALGLEFLTTNGDQVSPPIPANWSHIARLDGTIDATLPPIRIACDVTNPLLGRRGAAAVYGPQKGLRADDLARLDHESARLGLMLCAHLKKPDTLMDTPGAGAAGGISFGLMAGANAQLLSGFDLVTAWLDLEAKLAAADLVITGEGRFDASSLEGKGPGAVAARALALGKAVHVFAGAVTAPPRDQLALHAITPVGIPLAQALRDAPQNLVAAVTRAFSA